MAALLAVVFTFAITVIAFLLLFVWGLTTFSVADEPRWRTFLDLLNRFNPWRDD